MFLFSSQTIGVLVEAIAQGYSATNMGTLFLKAGVDGWEPDYAPNKASRVQQLLARMRKDDSAESKEGAFELARMVMADGSPWLGHPDGATWWPALRDALEADGFEFDTETMRLSPNVPGISVVEETTELEEVLPLAAEEVGGKRPREVRAAIDQLKSNDVLVKGEFNFQKGLWDLCQTQGPHPGLSDQQEARFRVMTASTYSRFLLARLDEVV